jgi:hypothetical protein
MRADIHDGQGARNAPATGRIQTRETNYLQIVTSGLHRTAGPYKVHGQLDGSPPGQRWGTFVRNHMPHVAAMDLFVVPTFGFNLLCPGDRPSSPTRACLDQCDGASDGRMDCAANY